MDDNFDKNPVGSYRRTFNLPEGWEKEKRVVLHFDGACSAIVVWVNGKYAGFSEGANTDAEFDVTALVRKGENNVSVRRHPPRRVSHGYSEGGCKRPLHNIAAQRRLHRRFYERGADRRQLAEAERKQDARSGAARPCRSARCEEAAGCDADSEGRTEDCLYRLRGSERPEALVV